LEEEELIEIKNLKINFDKTNISAFWIKTSSEFSNMSKRAIKILLFFSTLLFMRYLSMNEIKSKKRERLLSVKQKLRVSLLSRPRIKKLLE